MAAVWRAGGEGGSRAGIGVKLHGLASGEMRKVRGGTGRSRVPFLTRPNGRRLGSRQPGAGGGSEWNAGGGGPAGGGSAVQNLHARLAVLNLDVGLTASVDYIVLGDFNAGCGYASAEELGQFDISGPDYVWIVPHTANTNVDGSRCAYDRIVMDRDGKEDYAGVWGVDRGFTDKRVSDHWPVWAEFHVDKDGGG